MKICKLLLVPLCVLFIAWSWSKVEGIRCDIYHTPFFSGWIELWEPDRTILHEVKIHITAYYEHGSPKEYDIYRAQWGQGDGIPDVIKITEFRDSDTGVIQKAVIKGKCKEGKIDIEMVSSGFTF